MKYLNLPVFSSGGTYKIYVKKIFLNKKSEYQDISILETLVYGKCLIIDGIMQTSNSDHEIYDQLMLRNLSKMDKRILILGGGDGYVAEMALLKNPNLEVIVLEIDAEVVRACERYLDQKIFQHKNVKLFIGDALDFWRDSSILRGKKFDGIVSDLTDNPVNLGLIRTKFESFYSQLLSSAILILKKGGWISIQGGASEVTIKYIDSAKIIKKLAKKYFASVSSKEILIPSFGERCTFVYGKKK